MDSSLLKHEQQKKNNKFKVSQKTEESAQLQDLEHLSGFFSTAAWSLNFLSWNLLFSKTAAEIGFSQQC